MELYRSFKFLEISWNPSTTAVEMSWKDFAKGEDFRNALSEGLDLLASKKSSNWLADLRQLGVVTRQDQDWSDNVWFPKAVESGVRKIAIIMPKSALSKMSVLKVISNLEHSQIETAYFDSVESARSWFRD